MPAEKKKKQDSESKMEICGEKKIKEGVNVLKLLNKKFVEEDLKKQPLLEDKAESCLQLQVTLKKIPPAQLIRMIRVPLPHSLLTETSEVCLITGDLEKRNHKAEVEPTVLHYKDLLRKQGVTKVSQVIPLRQLRTEYKTFESRRQLAAAYDVFLVDKKIAGVMAKTLGKSFFQSRKFPIQIDMKRPNLKDQIDKALCQTEFSLTCRGNSYAFEVARLSMEDEAIVENIKTCIEVLEKKLPGKGENILGLYLKTAKSKAIPIYVSLDIPDEIFIKKPRRNHGYQLGALSTTDNAEVKVFRDGRVIVRKMKKKSGSSEDAAKDDLMESEEDTQEFNEVPLKKKKKKASGAVEITNNIKMENKEDSAKVPRKKKKKASISVEITNNTGMENDEDSAKASNAVEITKNTEIYNVENNEDSAKIPRKKTYDAIEIAHNTEMENEENMEDSEKASRKKKKKNKKSAGLVEEEDNRNFTANVVSRKKKKKYANVDETTDIVEIRKKKVQDSVSAEISPKKKRKGRKSILALKRA